MIKFLLGKRKQYIEKWDSLYNIEIEETPTTKGCQMIKGEFDTFLHYYNVVVEDFLILQSQLRHLYSKGRLPNNYKEELEKFYKIRKP